MLLTLLSTTGGACQKYGSRGLIFGESDSEGGPGVCILEILMPAAPGPLQQAPSGAVVLMTEGGRPGSPPGVLVIVG